PCRELTRVPARDGLAVI
ncbi:hypothetical protein CABS02_15496, partial [Colletotrichum abscissum]